MIDSSDDAFQDVLLVERVYVDESAEAPEEYAVQKDAEDRPYYERLTVSQDYPIDEVPDMESAFVRSCTAVDGHAAALNEWVTEVDDRADSAAFSNRVDEMTDLLAEKSEDAARQFQDEYHEELADRAAAIAGSVISEYDFDGLDTISKDRVYIDNPQEAPDGVDVQMGDQGGFYYTSEQEIPNIESDAIHLVEDLVAEYGDELARRVAHEIGSSTEMLSQAMAIALTSLGLARKGPVTEAYGMLSKGNIDVQPGTLEIDTQIRVWVDRPADAPDEQVVTASEESNSHGQSYYYETELDDLSPRDNLDTVFSESRTARFERFLDDHNFPDSLSKILVGMYDAKGEFDDKIRQVTEWWGKTQRKDVTSFLGSLEKYTGEQYKYRDGVWVKKDVLVEGYPGVPVSDTAPEAIEFAERWKQENNPREDGPMLYDLLGSGTMNWKSPKAFVNYKTYPVGKGDDMGYCGNCQYLWYSNQTGNLICSNVRGPVGWDHWCEYWSYAESDDLLAERFGGRPNPESAQPMSEVEGDE